MSKNKEIVVNTKLILTYFVDTIHSYLHENVKAEVIRKSKFNDSSVKEPLYGIIEKLYKKVIPKGFIKISEEIQKNELLFKKEIIQVIIKKFSFPLLSLYDKNYEEYTSRELLLIIAWSFSFLNVFSELTETTSRGKERPSNSNQPSDCHHSSSKSAANFMSSSLFILNRYPPQGIAQHLFPTDTPTTHFMTPPLNSVKNIELKNKINFIRFSNQQIKYQLRSIYSIQQNRCKLFYQFQKQQFDSNVLSTSPTSTVSSFPTTSYYQFFIKKKNKNTSSTSFNPLKEQLMATGLSTEVASHSRKITLHSMNSFFYEVEPSLKDETLERLQSDMIQFDQLVDHYTKEYYLWKWMSSVFNEYKKEQMNHHIRKNSYLLQNKKEVLMNLFDQVQQFKSFFKENILISFKNESNTPQMKPFIPQLQNQYISLFHQIDSPNSFYSFLNNSSFVTNKDYFENSISSPPIDQDKNSHTSSPDHSTLKINLIHPIFNAYTNAKPMTIHHTIYYQYLPPTSKPSLKSKIKSKSNQKLNISSSSLSTFPAPSSSNFIHESYLPPTSTTTTSSPIKKELHHTVSLPNLNTSLSMLTAASSTKSMKVDSRYPSSIEEDSPENEEDDILLCPITQGIEEDQQTLKKLLKKVNLLRKENQDLLDNILAKRMAKEHQSMKNHDTSLPLQQIKIIP